MQKFAFMAACRHYFGLKPQQTLSEFAQEVKALSDEDRAWFKREFVKVGYEVE